MYHREDYVTYTEDDIISALFAEEEDLEHLIASDILESYELLLEAYKQGKVIYPKLISWGQELKHQYRLVMSEGEYNPDDDEEL